MSVVTYTFLLFLFAVVVLYYIVPKKIQWMVLLCASLIFYAYAGVRYLAIVVITAIGVYLIAGQMQKNLEQQQEMLVGADRKTARGIKNEMRKKRKKFFVLGLVLVIGILAVFKGTSFAVSNVNALLGVMGLKQFPMIRIAAPLGISFYSFMMISYMAELYFGRISAEKNFAKYLTFVLYFPHVTQGPIARFDETAPQIFAQHSFDYDKVLKGLWLLQWGFFKKLVIADRIAIFVNEVFGNTANYRGPIFFFAGVMYSIQIYCDFSGCMDIVCGVSEMFGIKLAENFIRPYFSETLPEFWRRWHASLGAFFREYVFYPVSTSAGFLKLNTNARKALGNDLGKNLATCVPILCVWILTGIWHGANWNFIGWGCFHGILICLSTIFEQPLDKLTKRLGIRTECFSFRLFRMLRTFLLCVVGRIIFMGNGLYNSFWMMASCIARLDKTYNLCTDFNMTLAEWMLILIGCIILFCVSLAQEIRSKNGNTATIRDWLADQNIWFRWIVLFGGLMIILFFGVYGSGLGESFIYEQF